MLIVLLAYKHVLRSADQKVNNILKTSTDHNESYGTKKLISRIYTQFIQIHGYAFAKWLFGFYRLTN